MAAPQKPFGFTLIELMITIAVLVILVTLAAPAFNLAEQRRVIGAAESALDPIQTARSEAIKQGRNIYFVSPEEGNDWCLGISDRPNCNCMSAETEADACKIKLSEDGGTDDDGRFLRTTQSTDFRNVRMTEAIQEIEFNHVRGTLADLDARRLVFASDNYSMEVQINPIGRTRACGTDRAMGAYSEC